MKIGKREILYVFLMTGAIALGFIKLMVFGVFLSPRFLGYYSIVITVASYGEFLQLGIMNGLNRELPVTFGRRRTEYYSGLVGEATLTLSSFMVIGLAVYYIVIAQMTFNDLFIRNAFLLAGLLSFSYPFGQIIILRLRAEQRILSFSSLQFINALGSLLLGILAIKYMSYIGPILVLVAINFISFMVVNKTMLKPVNYLYFKIKEIFYLIRIGFPLMVAGILFNLQLSMDRLFLIKKASAEQIGIYQIGTLPLTLGTVIATIVGAYVTPKLLFRYGQGASLKYLFKRSLIISLIIIGSMFIFLPIVSTVANFIINHWLPDYRNSLPFIPVFYLGGIFIAANIVSIVILAANRQILSLYICAFLVCICFIGYLLVAKFNMNIQWYAYVNVATQIINFFLITGISYYLVKNQNKSNNLINNN